MRRTLYQAVIALLICCIAFAQPQDAELMQAVAAQQAGKLDEAIKGYRAYLKRAPNSVEARSNLGAALASRGHFDEAITEYKAALQHASSNPGIRLNLALAYYKSGEIGEAARELVTLRALAPDNSQVTLLLADCWLGMGENAKVIELLGPLEPKQPDDLALAYMLGTALIREKRVAEGQKQLDKIFKRGDSAEARLLLGTAKLTASEFADSLVELRRAVELNPKLPAVHSYLGKALMATGDAAGAAQAFRKELETNPNDFESHLNLAVLLKQDRDYEAVRLHLGRALRVRKGDPGARYQLATIDIAEGKLESARKELESLVKESPKFTEAHVSLATVYYRLKRKADGDREQAIIQQLNAEAQAKQPGAALVDKP